MADAIISIVAKRVATIIEDQIRYQVNLVRGVEKEIIDLSEKLKTIRNVLDDAEKRGVKEQSVKRWLKKLEDTAYETDDILDEWNYALLKHPTVASAKHEVRCSSFIPSSCLCFDKVVVRRHTAKKIQNVKAILDQILKDKADFNFVEYLPATDHVLESWRVQSTSSIEHEKVHGRDEDRNNIVRKLMVDGNGGDSQIVCIVGMGGIGKTTLAQLVYNDSQVEECFKLRIWICVSDPFDVGGIAKGIVESVTKKIIPPNTNQLELVLQKLRDSILGKKFVLVLDDVWKEDYNKWEPLKINLKYGAQGSKILVTTRNERVAKMMRTSDDEIYRPRQLSDEECWSLLRRISLSGKSEEECGVFEDVGKKIASKCKGLPLAANVLGSLLQFKNSLEEWESVWKSEIWQLEKAEVELFPHLLLSYNELSPALKRCFSYCAVYPKDYRINAESLIEEWMALGYLGSVIGNVGAELKGREYLNNLAMRSLFQDIEKSGESGEKIERCKMHDIVHDFAQFLRENNDMKVEGADMRKRSCQVCDPILVSRAQEFRSLFRDKITPPNLCDCLTSLRVLRFEPKLNGTPNPIQGMDKLIHLRWLELSKTKLAEEDLKIICSLYFLQTLLLVLCSLKEIPQEIGNLVDLRHLDLHSNHELEALPESMCGLVGLQILNIKHCSDMYGLPQGIHRLQNLQRLLLFDTPLSCRLPQGVGQLSGLCSLGLMSFHGGRRWNKLGLLKNLNLLTGSLKLVIHSINTTDLRELGEDAREAELRNKIHIQALEIVFRDETDEMEQSSSSLSSSTSLWMDVLEGLEPHHMLKCLRIRGYMGSRLPHWVSSPLNLLKEIKLVDLSELSSLPSMGKLPLLELLYIDQMKELKFVGREFLGIESSSSSSSTSDAVAVAFPKLKQLTFSECYKWEEWEDITFEEKECAALSVMPRLTELNIVRCKCLKKLLHLLLRKASSSLQILCIERSWELVESYGDNDGSPYWRSISCYNPQLQLRPSYHY